jgi:hypothetical protein
MMDLALMVFIQEYNQQLDLEVQLIKHQEKLMVYLVELNLVHLLQTTPSTTFNHVAGLAGNFAVIGTYSNNGLMAGVLGIINTNTLSGDAAVMAFMQGDSGVTTARAAYGVAMAQTTSASGFDYGIDLKIQDPVLDGGGPSSVHTLQESKY